MIGLHGTTFKLWNIDITLISYSSTLPPGANMHFVSNVICLDYIVNTVLFVGIYSVVNPGAAPQGWQGVAQAAPKIWLATLPFTRVSSYLVI